MDKYDVVYDVWCKRTQTTRVLNGDSVGTTRATGEGYLRLEIAGLCVKKGAFSGRFRRFDVPDGPFLPGVLPQLGGSRGT